jgi:hypothetical protein
VVATPTGLLPLAFYPWVQRLLLWEVLHILSVSLALGIQHVMRMRHILIGSLPGSTVFFPHIIS